MHKTFKALAHPLHRCDPVGVPVALIWLTPDRRIEKALVVKD